MHVALSPRGAWELRRASPARAWSCGSSLRVRNGRSRVARPRVVVWLVDHAACRPGGPLEANMLMRLTAALVIGWAALLAAGILVLKAPFARLAAPAARRSHAPR